MMEMKILLTSDAVGGVWTYAVELCRALAPYSTEIVLVTMGPRPSAEQSREIAQLHHVLLRESDFKLEWMNDPWREVDRASDWLLDLEREHQPHLVHLNGYVHGSLPWQAPALVVAHSCVCSWWRAVKKEQAPGSWDTYRQRVQHGLQDATSVVAPSHAMLECLWQDYGPLPASHVIYNGRDPALYRPAIKEPFILTAGRLWDEAKNVAAIEAVAHELPWPVVLAGDERSPDGSSIASSSVQRLGRLTAEQMAQCFARASIYALPARYEPFGLSALEAALSGCALVLGDIPSLREIWHDAAIYVDPDDRLALRDVVRGLIDDEPRRKELAQRAVARAARFTPRRMAEGYVELYRRLCSQRRLVAVPHLLETFTGGPFH
jgi:glycogen synthase